MTMTLVSTVTVASNSAGFNFTGIPATGTDLLLLMSLRSYRNYGGFNNFFLRLNNNSSTVYSYRDLNGTGSSSNSTNTSNNTEFVISSLIPEVSNTSNTFTNLAIYIPNYAGSTNKSVSIDAVGENNATASPQTIFAGLFGSTSAITQINFLSDVAPNSTASLYTITKGSGGATVS